MIGGQVGSRQPAIRGAVTLIIARRREMSMETFPLSPTTPIKGRNNKRGAMDGLPDSIENSGFGVGKHMSL